MQMPDNLPNQEKRRSLTITPSHPHHPPPLFHSFSLAYCSFPIFLSFLSKVCSRKAQLINFSLLISFFSCISCFASLDVLIKIILFRFCFWTSFPLLTGNELRCRRNITRTSAGRWHYRQLKGAYERTVGVISETGWFYIWTNPDWCV